MMIEMTLIHSLYTPCSIYFGMVVYYACTCLLDQHLQPSLQGNKKQAKSKERNQAQNVLVRQESAGNFVNI